MGRGCYLENELLDSSGSLTILQRIAQDDKKAVKECIDRYSTLVRNITRRCISNKTDAEDVVQEIFIDIWKNAGRFDATQSPEGAFVMLIARRRVIDRLRKVNRHPKTSFFENALLNLPNNDYKKLQNLTDEKPALEALSKLNSHQKQMIAMAVFKGMTHLEIAKTVGLPLGTIKANIRRGLQKLRDCIHLTNVLPMKSRASLYFKNLN